MCSVGSYVNLYNPNFNYIYRSKSRKKANNSAVPPKAGGAAGGKAAKEPKATKRGASKKSSKSNNSNNAGIPQMPLDTGKNFKKLQKYRLPAKNVPFSNLILLSDYANHSLVGWPHWLRLKRNNITKKYGGISSSRFHIK